MTTKLQYRALTFVALTLTVVSSFAAAQDIVIDSGTDETVISRLPAAPEQEEPVCSNSADGTLGPCAVLGADDRFSQRILGGATCGASGCLFATASGSFDVPAGKVVLIETVTITYDIDSNPATFVRATASFQTFSPFQRFAVGEMLPVVYTGAIGMATANLNLYASEITGVVTFPDVRPAADTVVGVSVYVTGRLIDAPTP